MLPVIIRVNIIIKPCCSIHGIACGGAFFMLENVPIENPQKLRLDKRSHYILRCIQSGREEDANGF